MNNYLQQAATKQIPLDIIGMKGRGQGIARISGLKAIKALENNGLPMAIETPIRFQLRHYQILAALFPR